MINFRESCINVGDNKTLLELFHEETSLDLKNEYIFSRGISKAFDNPTFMKKILEVEHNFNRKGIALDVPEINNTLINAIQNRCSARSFKSGSVSYDTLSAILYYAYGPNKHSTYTIPSAGGTYPIKIILNIRNVDKLDPGLYEYQMDNKNLLCISNEPELIPENITKNDLFFNTCSFSVHLIANPEYICYKYQDRGYRFMNLECGHLAQNLILISTMLGVSSICSGGFLDGEFISYLNSVSANGYQEYFYLYEIFFGK